MWPTHGSNPQYLFKAAGIQMPENFIDFSANINPLGPPVSLKENWHTLYEKITQYPDPNATNLKRQLAIREGIEESNILIGNGGAELISLMGRKLFRKKVMIIQPAFSEYEQACKANECQITYFCLEEGWALQIEKLKHELNGHDALFLCNPTNPTGIYYPKEVISQLLHITKEYNCLLIIDEAFYDFLEGYESIVPYIKQYSHLIILRSMTKMFAIPGIRLGYLIAKSEIVEDISCFQTHWSVNSIAQWAGAECLQNEEYIEKTKRLIMKERANLFEFYRENGFVFSESEVNFYLVRDPKNEDTLSLFYFLLENGIVPRHTFNFPSLEGRWLRLAIKNSDDHDRLLEVMLEWRQKHR